jgi:hypothetical protein
MTGLHPDTIAMMTALAPFTAGCIVYVIGSLFWS